MYLSSKLLIYSFRENRRDGIISHYFISRNKKKASGNQEMRFTISHEFISNKLAILLGHHEQNHFFNNKKRIKYQP